MGKYLSSLSENFTPLIVNIISGILLAWIATIAAGWSETKRRKWIATFGLGVLIIILSVITLNVISLLNKVETAQVIFSDLNRDLPVNSYDAPWEVFNDNLKKGNSNVTIETHPSPGIVDDYYATLAYYLGDKSTSKSFCGVSSVFSPKLCEPRDVSGFTGIQLDAWREGDWPEGVRAYMRIYPRQLVGISDGYYQYDLTDLAKRTETRTRIEAPFTDFKPAPDPNSANGPFDKTLRKEIHSIAIVIQGDHGRVYQGKIAFDNLKFF